MLRRYALERVTKSETKKKTNIIRNITPTEIVSGYTDYTGYRGNQHVGYNPYQHRQTTEYTVATHHQQPHSYTYQGEQVINDMKLYFLNS